MYFFKKDKSFCKRVSVYNNNKFGKRDEEESRFFAKELKYSV